MSVTYKRAVLLDSELIKAIKRMQRDYPDKDDKNYLQNRSALLSRELLKATEYELFIGNFEPEEDE